LAQIAAYAALVGPVLFVTIDLEQPKAAAADQLKIGIATLYRKLKRCETWHGEYLRSAPTAEHFIPLLYIAGLAGAAGQPLETVVDGYAFGSLSMAAYTLDANCSALHGDTPPSAPLPYPALVPPEEANV
jgi:hypothetical protein